MRFDFGFRALPSATGGRLTPRPVADVWIEGIDSGPLTALVDTGAVRTCFSAELAELAGVESDARSVVDFGIGGITVQGRPARATLSLKDQDSTYSWGAPIWFCEPWPFAFQLLGLDGFLRHFRVTISAYDEWLACEPPG